MTALVHLANVLSLFAPVRESFGLRRALLRLGGIRIGRGTKITHAVRFHGRQIEIGKDVWLGMGTVLASADRAKIVVGDSVDIAPGCCIVSGTHRMGTSERRAGEGYGIDVDIGSGTWVGACTTILPGARVGAGSMIAAGSVVLAGDYPENSLLAGVPAIVKRQLDGTKEASQAGSS